MYPLVPSICFHPTPWPLLGPSVWDQQIQYVKHNDKPTRIDCPGTWSCAALIRRILAPEWRASGLRLSSLSGYDPFSSRLSANKHGSIAIDLGQDPDVQAQSAATIACVSHTHAYCGLRSHMHVRLLSVYVDSRQGPGLVVETICCRRSSRSHGSTIGMIR